MCMNMSIWYVKVSQNHVKPAYALCNMHIGARCRHACMHRQSMHACMHACMHRLTYIAGHKMCLPFSVALMISYTVLCLVQLHSRLPAVHSCTYPSYMSRIAPSTLQSMYKNLTPKLLPTCPKTFLKMQELARRPSQPQIAVAEAVRANIRA